MAMDRRRGRRSSGWARRCGDGAAAAFATAGRGGRPIRSGSGERGGGEWGKWGVSVGVGVGLVGQGRAGWAGWAWPGGQLGPVGGGVLRFCFVLV